VECWSSGVLGCWSTGVSAAKSANSSVGKIRLQAFNHLLGMNRDTGGAAYATLGSATRVAPLTGRKVNRQRLCGQDLASDFNHRLWYESGHRRGRLWYLGLGDVRGR
jgi:hypothetical protein